MPKIVAIHQPNFFPWLGYFHKIAHSDVFIFLDDVQFPKTGGVWTNRVKLLFNGEERWFTAAIDRSYHGMRNISDMSFLSRIPWRKKLFKSLESSYRSHPFFCETMELVAPLLLNQEANIANYNVHAVTTIAKRVGLNVGTMHRSSAILHHGRSNELLCSLTISVKGDSYLCGGGADGYLDAAAFEQSQINLQFQNFVHPIYPQHGRGDFVSGLSVIDAAMNIGWDVIKGLLKTDRC